MKGFKSLQIVLTSLLFSMLVLLTGCPFYSDVPIDDGTVKIPAMMAGKWVAKSEKPDKPNKYFEISITSDFRCLAKEFEFSDKDSVYKETDFEVTLSDVDNEIFLNVYDVELGGYYLYKIEFDNAKNEMTLYEVTEYIKEKFDTSPQLKSFVVAGKKNSYFFSNAEETYTRM